MINDVILQAKKRAREIAETQYQDSCTVIEQNKKNEQMEEIVLENQPCKLTYRNLTSSKESTTTNEVIQEILLFIAPEVDIKPGSKLEITHKGKVETFKNSGKPNILDTHQEIILEIFKGWA